MTTKEKWTYGFIIVNSSVLNVLMLVTHFGWIT